SSGDRGYDVRLGRLGAGAGSTRTGHHARSRSLGPCHYPQGAAAWVMCRTRLKRTRPATVIAGSIGITFPPRPPAPAWFAFTAFRVTAAGIRSPAIACARQDSRFIFWTGAARG